VPFTAHDRAHQIEKSAIQLVSFDKTALLQPGASQDITLVMDLFYIASFDAVAARTFLLEDGRYYFAIGNGAHSALNNVMAEMGYTVADGMTANGNANHVRVWVNDTFRAMRQPDFGPEGFTTINGLYRTRPNQPITTHLDNACLNYFAPGSTLHLSRTNWERTWGEWDYQENRSAVWNPTALYTTRPAAINPSGELRRQLLFVNVYEPGSTDTSHIRHGVNTSYSLIDMKGESFDHPQWERILDQMTIGELLETIGRNFGGTSPIIGINYPGSVDNDGAAAGPVGNFHPRFNVAMPANLNLGVSNFSDINARMFPSHSTQAMTFNQALLFEIGEMFCESGYYAGHDGLWGPGMNIIRVPQGGRNTEYFSSCPQHSFIAGAQMTAGMQSNGMIAAPKHFAFNDHEMGRYGYGAFMTEQTAREIQLRAFEGAVAVGGARKMMNALNRLGPTWVGNHDGVQNQILRGEWNFSGYVLTDNANGNFQTPRGVAFGTDKWMLMSTRNTWFDSELNRTVLLNDARLFEAVRTANHRILYVYVNSRAMNGIAIGAQVVRAIPWWEALLISFIVIFAVFAAATITMYVLSILKEKKGGKKS